MNPTGKFTVPDEPEGRLHLYEWAAPEAGGRRLSPMGFVWEPVEADLFGDEAVPACGQCGRPAVVGWKTATTHCCSACVTLHEGRREPCVLFHKWNKRCWSEAAAAGPTGRGWSPDRAAATVYLTRAAAEAARGEFLEVVQKALLVVPLEGFDRVAAEYAEVT